MSGPAPPSIVLVAAQEEPFGDSAAPLLRHLLAHGFDAHVVRDAPAGPSAPADPGLEALPPDLARRRVHPPPLSLRRTAPRLELMGGAARAAGQHPLAVLRELVRGPDSLARYLRAVLLALDPALVHLSSTSAGRFAGVLSGMRARVVLSVLGEEAETVALEGPGRLSAALPRVHGLHVETGALAELLQGADLQDTVVAAIPPTYAPALVGEPLRPLRKNGPLRILSVGPLTWAQGYEYALHAVALLAGRGVPCRYRIVGRGDFADAVAFARHQLGIERLVEIVEPGDRDAVVAHLRWADVLVSPAVVARSPVTVLDAQTAGVPVVTTEPPPGGGGTALVVSRRDAEALAEGLARLAAEPALRGRLAEAGRRVISSAITPAEQLDRFRELYLRVLGGTRPPG